jgi:hypothetical protein
MSRRAPPFAEASVGAGGVSHGRRDPSGQGSVRAGGIRHRGRDNQGIEEPSPLHASGPARGSQSDGWVGRASAWIVPTKNPTRVVYGIITVGALMAAESGHHETYAEAVASAFIATGVYWLLHAYSSVLGHRLETGERLAPGVLWRGLAEEWGIVRGAAVPLSALVIAWAAGASQETGVTAALWTAVASLVAFELAAGLRSHAAPGELALEVGVGIAMGAAILALRLVLH